MSDPLGAMQRLDTHAIELDQLSRGIAAINRELQGLDQHGRPLPEPGVEDRYQTFVDDFEVGLWLKCQEDGGPRWPSESMREKLARREMPAELLGRRDGLVRKRDRMRRRIDELQTIIGAERSLLSAQKVEAEVGGSPSMTRRAA